LALTAETGRLETFHIEDRDRLSVAETLDFDPIGLQAKRSFCTAAKLTK
jgi:hypothetical protein